MKIKMWFPIRAGHTAVPFVYAMKNDNEYYYAYNPTGIYAHMPGKRWHGPFRLDGRKTADEFYDCEHLVLCPGAALKKLHEFGFVVENFNFEGETA